MELLSVFIIALGLSMDCFAVSIAAGLNVKTNKLSAGLKLAIIFGVFHIFMPLSGWLIGSGLRFFISTVDHWIAFLLLFFIGVKMILESFKTEKPEIHSKHNTLFMLGLATSIDSLVVGISLALLHTPPYLTAIIIGITAASITFIGFDIGKRIGFIVAEKFEFLGGLVLVGIGLKILLEHLF